LIGCYRNLDELQIEYRSPFLLHLINQSITDLDILREFSDPLVGLTGIDDGSRIEMGLGGYLSLKESSKVFLDHLLARVSPGSS
jgi:hypothetical protein